MAVKVVLTLLTIAYPFLVYWAGTTVGSAYILPIIAVILTLRIAKSPQQSTRLGIALLALILGVSWFMFGADISAKLYPVLVNAGLFCVFGFSLLTKQTIIERFARLKEPNLPPSGVHYTRTVTTVWMAFFVFNGTLSLCTALWASTSVWTFYNGFLAYILIGLLALGEWLVRKRVKRKE